MLSFLIKLRRQVQRVLRIKATTRHKYVPSTRSRVIKAMMLILATLIIVMLYPSEDLYDPFDTPRKGEIAREVVIAPFPITLFKTEQELAADRERVRSNVPAVLDYDTTVVTSVRERLAEFVHVVDSLKRSVASPSPGKLDEFFQIVSNRFPLLSTSVINKSLSSSTDLKRVQTNLQKIYDEEIYRIGFVENLDEIPKTAVQTINILKGDERLKVPRDRLLDKAHAWGRLLTALNRLATVTPIDVDYYYQIGKTFMRPNLTVDIHKYNSDIAEALAQVTNIKEPIDEGDIIVRSGQKVTAQQEEILKEMARIQRLQAAEQNTLSAYLPFVGRIVLVLAIFGTFYLFLYYFRRETFNSNPRLLAIFLVFAVQLFLVYIVNDIADLVDVQSVYIYPIAVLPIMITILFDAEVGILATIVLAMLLGVMQRFSFSITLMTIVIGLTACFTTRRVRKRTDFYRIMLAVMAAYIVLIFVVENLRLSPGPEILADILYGAIIAVLSIIVTIFLLPIFESLFGFTTDITLLELSDLNHPLLKRLAMEAPGTYHHTISVGNLAEAAAKAINANALLARVGTYYHDIGKIEIPEYFVENQLSVTSRHEALTPSMSALILSSHVKKGRTLGEEAGIPDDVLNFIEEHHGTMVMSYFYNKALEQGADESVVDKYRYPGPKPQTRETGIAMLADAAEAASRTLDDPKPARLHNLIQRIINERFQSGELDECPLTLRDLAKIREAFAQVLMASFHHRVAYPKKKGESDE